MSEMNWRLYTDGGARGNPGPAAFGYYLKTPDGQEIRANGLLGIQTNNVAEYQGIIHGLQGALDIGVAALEVYCDSQVAVKQLNGEYKVKEIGLKPLFSKAKELAAKFPGGVRFSHIRREENKKADDLVNEALDGAAR
jgi:ribonuclease HI